MGILQLSEIRSEIDLSLGDRDNITPARIDLWVNMAYFDISSGIEFRELDATLALPTVNGQRLYTGPTSPLTVHAVRDVTNDKLLTWVSRLEFLRLSTAATGALSRWTMEGTQIALHPTPTGVVNTNVYYRATPTKLIADADVTVLPGWGDVALILLGSSYGLLSVGEDQRGIVWLNRLINYLSSRVTGVDLDRLVQGLKQTVANLEAPLGLANS